MNPGDLLIAQYRFHQPMKPLFLVHPAFNEVLCAAVLLTAGCGITGGTTARRAALVPEIARATLDQPVQCGTVELASGAVHHRRIGTYDWGRFNDADLATFRRSLELSLATPQTPTPPANALAAHVRIQHFACAFTNNRVPVFKSLSPVS
jgi:hypothetical protein